MLPPRSPLARHWTLDPDVVFLNHGSFGACPTPVLAAQRRYQELLEAEPVRFFVERCEGLLDRSRARLAELLSADAASLAFVPNATAGVNAVVRSLRFEPGDELLTSTHEYNACNNVLHYAAEQWGARVVVADVPFPVASADEIVRSILARVTPRTRLVLLSHVTSPTGLVLPVAPIVHALNARGVDTLVDGAHAPGMVPLDLRALNAPYYTGNLHKWLCTPKGCAFLHVRADRQSRVRPAVISHGANSARTDRSRFLLEFDYTGTADVSPYLCIPYAIDFLSGLIPGGLPGLMAHNRANALAARQILCEALHVPPPAPEELIGALASVPLPLPPGGVITPSARGYAESLWDRLIERHRIQIPVFVLPVGGARPTHRLIRVSMQAYNTLEQVRYLAAAVGEELARERGAAAS